MPEDDGNHLDVPPLDLPLDLPIGKKDPYSNRPSPRQLIEAFNMLMNHKPRSGLKQTHVIPDVSIYRNNESISTIEREVSMKQQ